MGLSAVTGPFVSLTTKCREEHRRRLESVGIDVVATQQSGQFKLFDWHDAYFQPDHFDQRRMIALLEKELKAGAKQGFRRSRSIAHMKWSLDDRPGVEDLVE